MLDRRGKKATIKAAGKVILFVLGMGFVFLAGALIDNAWTALGGNYPLLALLLASPIVLGLTMTYLIYANRRGIFTWLFGILLCVLCLAVMLWSGYALVQNLKFAAVWASLAFLSGIVSGFCFNKAIGKRGEWLKALAPG